MLTTKIRKTTSITLAQDMGGAASFKPIFNVTFPFFLITITTTLTLIGPLIVAEADDDSRETPPIPSREDNNGGTTVATATPPPSGPSTRNSGHFTRRTEPFKPSTAVVVGVLTTMFSLTFLLLLYIKHCNGGNVYVDGNLRGSHEAPPLRKNSGIDRAVVEKLPTFRFGSLRGRKEGLDCAVCLTRFETNEVLRLLPKCKHAFHVECVDKWLDAHSTCPLCRYKVEAKDIVTRQQQEQEQEDANPEEEPLDIERGTVRRVSGRHSEGGFLEIVSQNTNENETASSRRSLDSASRTFGGGFVRPRRDGKLLTREDNRSDAEHRLEHRIIIDSPPSSVKSNGDGGSHQERWSEVRPVDLLYLTSEMIISDANSVSPQHQNTRGARRTVHNRVVSDVNGNGSGGGSGGGLSLRSFSEITGVSRFLGGNRNRGREGGREEQERRQHEGVSTRWSAWSSR